MAEKQEQYREEEYSSGEPEPGTPPSFGGVPDSEGLGYDNEWTRFINSLAMDSTMAHIVAYLRKVDLTDRAKDKLIIYTKTILDAEFAVSRIRDPMDLTRLIDDKNLVDCDIALGLTIFDITPEFQHCLNLLRLKFGIKIRRSYGGYERKMLATSRQESITEDRTRPQADTERGIREKTRSLFR